MIFEEAFFTVFIGLLFNKIFMMHKTTGISIENPGSTY